MAKSTKQISAFVKKVLSAYGIDDVRGLISGSEPSEEVNIEDEDTIKTVSIMTGLSREEILNTDEEAAKKYWKKYPFFMLERQLISDYSYAMRYKKTSAEKKLANAVNKDKYDEKQEKRYHTDNIKTRLVNQLLEIDKYMPGTYHRGANIVNLYAETSIMICFPEVKIMLDSLFDMLNYAKSKFFKAVKSGLCEEEKKEYDFIVYALDIKDCATNEKLTYDRVRQYKDVIAKENYNEFMYYAKIGRLRYFQPWVCKEFYLEKNMLENLLQYRYDCKTKIREFLLDVQRITCVFNWSDAEKEDITKTIEIFSGKRMKTEEKELLRSVSDSCDRPDRKQPVLIYVKKTEEEIAEFEDGIEDAKKMICAPSMGGVKVPEKWNSQVFDSNYSFKRLMQRAEAKR